MEDGKKITYRSWRDFPPAPFSQGTMAWNRTGDWRYIRPIYRDKVPPCNNGCPAGCDIEGWLRLADDGDYLGAWQRIREESPFPGVCGRVCFHPCETACNRGQFDRSVSINNLERHVYDFAASRGVTAEAKILKPESGKRVAVIGSGPAGLTCAYHLARFGHKVVVFEKLEKPGGVMRYGIPSYRLPRNVLDNEIAPIAALGVEIRCGVDIGKDKSLAELTERFDALFLATGAHRSRALNLPDEDHSGVLSGLDFLRRVASGLEVQVGKRVAVIGGGNTAVDAARTAMRLGASATIFYRRSRQEMPAHAEEIAEAEREGVALEVLRGPEGIVVEEGKLTGLKLSKMELGEPDDSGRRRPLSIPGSSFTEPVDTILTAIGELASLDYLTDSIETKWGAIVTGNTLATTMAGVYAGGDATEQPRTVVDAIGAGKRAAVSIDAMLLGRDPEKALAAVALGDRGAISVRRYLGMENADRPGQSRSEVCSYESLNTVYFVEANRSRQPKRAIFDRTRNFAEVNLGLTADGAIRDVARCFHCGRCTLCDNCYVYCPDVSVIPRRDGGFGYIIDYEHCKGCGLCIAECPRNAMEMRPEEDFND